MNTEKIPHDFITSERITVDYLNYTDQIRQLFPRHFREPNLRKFGKDRQEIVNSLLEYNRKLNAPKETIQNIERLSQSETFTIVTGQQPGIFSGPLYTVYKAISTIVMCERLSNKKYSLVPVFWNASEDHDLSEVNQIILFKFNEPFRINYNGKSKGVSFSHIHLLKSDLKRILSLIHNISPDSEFKTHLLNEIEAIIERSTTIGDFFSRFMIYLLGDLGLIMIEPQHLRELMAPIFERLIRKPTECTKILVETGSHLEKLGYTPKIHKKSTICNFFILSTNGKRLQVSYNGKFQVGNEMFSQKELLHMLNDDPHRFSANAITRPITQDFLFPTFAYVAGPNEIAYYAQLRQVYDFFSVEMPVIFPRFGVTILEKKISKVLSKYAVEIVEVKDPERLLKKLAKERIEDVFKSFRNEIFKSMEEVTQKAESLDKTLIVPCSVAKGRILKTIEGLEDKVSSRLKKHDLITRQQIIKAYNNLFPNGDLQERQINVLEYLVKFGKNLMNILYRDFLEADYGEHRVIKC